MCTDVDRVNSYLSKLYKEYDGSFRVLSLRNREISKIELNNRHRRGLIRDLVQSYTSFRNFKQIGDSIKDHELSADSLVFLMWLDSFIAKYMLPFFLNFLFPYKWGGLFFHPGHLKFNQEANSYYRDLLHYIPIFDSNKLEFVGLFDRLMVDKLTTKQKRDVFNWLPDVTESDSFDLNDELIKSIITLAGKRKIVSLLGSLDRRKNILSFLDVVKNCKEDNIFYVCVGQLHKNGFNASELEYIYKVADDYRDKLFFYDKHIESDSTFDAIFFLSSIIVAVYERFPSSSNIITKSAKYNKKIIVSNDHLMAEIVSYYGIGKCVKSGDYVSLKDCILLLLNNNILSENYELFNNEYSLKNLKNILSVLKI
jgi:hypothetical protein